MTTPKRLKCEKRNGINLQFLYIEYGTKGFVKTLNGEIRECKCLGGTLKPQTGWGVMEYMWKVAGVDEIQHGTKNTIPLGVIYKSLEGATYGTCRGSLANSEPDTMDENGYMFPIPYLAQKYGIGSENVRFIGAHMNIIELKTFLVSRDSKVIEMNTDFNLSVTKDGVTIDIPSVDNESTFVSSDDAWNSIKPSKVFYLDDDKGKEDVSSYTRLVVDIKESKMDDLRDIAIIVGKIF